MAEIPVIDWGSKHVAEKYPNGLDWSDFLTDDNGVLDDQTIVSVTATVIEGTLTIDDPAVSFPSGNYQYVWLSGGNPQETVLIQCLATTNDGWVLEQHVRLEIYE